VTGLQGPAILALGDATPASDNAAWRAALVARDLGAPLRLLQLRRGRDGAGAVPLAREIRQRIGVVAHAQTLEGDALKEVMHAARDAQLLVIGTPRGNPLREFVLGTQAERLIRLCRIPVLVVKRAATASYQRVLVPVDLGEDARTVIAAAARVSRDPRMEVLHALPVRREVSLRVSDVSESLLRLQREQAAAHACSVLEERIAQAGARHHGVLPTVTFGDAAATVLAREQAARAELVVIGKRTRGLLADFFLGGVTQRVLAAARADVLVLPRPPAGQPVRRPAVLSA
jgi:nucleotide-binding universal stress UspA family protein